MSKLLFTGLFLAGSLAAGLFGYWLAAAPQQMPPMVASNEAKEPLFYRNPMNPEITSPVPAQDQMGMDYIPVYADSNQTNAVPGTVLIDPVTTQSMGVRTATTTHRSISKLIHTIGRVGYNEKGITRLHPKTEGWIEKMRIETTGETISEDEILLSIYSPQLVAAQQEYLLALANEGAAQSNDDLARTSLERLELLDVPAHQLKELQQTRKVKKFLHIHSPSAGTVISVGARNGQFVTPNTELYFIADLSRVWVFVDIFEDELAWVQVGDKAEMTIKGAPGKIFTGALTYIYPYAERRTRTIKARLEFDNSQLLLKPEMFADITLHTQRKAHVTAVPSEAIVRTGTREKVFVVRAPGKFEPREVSIGVSSDGWTEVLSGVVLGETVVVSAQFLIDSESKLREAVAKMAPIQMSEPMDHSGHAMPKTQDMPEVNGATQGSISP